MIMLFKSPFKIVRVPNVINIGGLRIEYINVIFHQTKKPRGHAGLAPEAGLEPATL